MSFWRRLLRGSSGLPEPPPFAGGAFVPGNDLERALQAGDAASMRVALPQARLFVPTLADVAALSEGDAFRPVVLDYDAGPCVAALTSADRLAPLLAAVPGVKSGIDVEAAWVLRNCPPGVGLALNPGWREGLVLPAAEVARLRSAS